MRYSVDKIEGGFAVCEKDDGELVKLALSLLPAEIREGDILNSVGSAFKIDRAATGAARVEMFDLQDSVFKKKQKS